MPKYQTLRDLWVQQLNTRPKSEATMLFHRAIHLGLHADGVLSHGGTEIQLQFVRLLLAMGDKEWVHVPAQRHDSYLYFSVLAARKAGYISERRDNRNVLLVRTTDKFRELRSGASIELTPTTTTTTEATEEKELKYAS